MLFFPFFCALLIGFGVGEAHARPDGPEIQNYSFLTLEISDVAGTPLEARVRIRGCDGRLCPDVPDSVHLSYWGGRGYSYADGSITVRVPRGTTGLTIGRGFEWAPYNGFLSVESDTAITIVLERFTDLREEGWFAGEIHAHSQHPPIDYVITPEISLRIARAEGLSVLHLLDQNYEFTGAPHPISDEETILHYSWEYRNQTYGHVSLPGLRESVGWGCCSAPEPAYPMLLDLRNLVVPETARMLVLAHPHTTDDYFYDEHWPGAGLGRELPVLAALGGLDALEVVSYSNDPDEDWTDWYDVLSAGLPCPVATGTDASLSNISSRPVGGWRVYADLGAYAHLDYDAWVEAFRIGRTFITNYPLIPEFEVDGVEPGGVIEVDSDSLVAPVRLRALCALGLRRLSIVAEGEEIWTVELPADPPRVEIDTMFTIAVPTPSWIAATVAGPAGHPHAVVGDPFAHTNAIRITQTGMAIRRTLPSARWLDELEMLEDFVELRGNWYELWQRDTVLARIDRARDFYAEAFVIAPQAFQLLHPEDGDTLHQNGVSLDWEDAIDEENGDRVSYTLRVYSDSTLTIPRLFIRSCESCFGEIHLPLQQWYWWSVEAIDRGGNTTPSIPETACFYLQLPIAGIEVETDDRGLQPRALPNPSHGPVTLQGFTTPPAIFDVAGRRVAGLGEGIEILNGAAVWNGMIRGGQAPPGLYWARSETGRRSVRLIRIR